VLVDSTRRSSACSIFSTPPLPWLPRTHLAEVLRRGLNPHRLPRLARVPPLEKFIEFFRH